MSGIVVGVDGSGHSQRALACLGPAPTRKGAAPIRKREEVNPGQPAGRQDVHLRCAAPATATRAGARQLSGQDGHTGLRCYSLSVRTICYLCPFEWGTGELSRSWTH